MDSALHLVWNLTPAHIIAGHRMLNLQDCQVSDYDLEVYSCPNRGVVTKLSIEATCLRANMAISFRYTQHWQRNQTAGDSVTGHNLCCA